jgi:2-phospho-L-lactate guanylyltransferase (CobY/MobA/RfbA family)
VRIDDVSSVLSCTWRDLFCSKLLLEVIDSMRDFRVFFVVSLKESALDRASSVDSLILVSETSLRISSKSFHTL